MRASKSELEKMFESSGAEIREAVWEDIHLDWETYHEPFDTTPLMKGLPDDRCQCPHYGYVLKGRFQVSYKDREETIKAGEAYYLAPGHLVKVEAGTELVEFSPKEEFKKTMEVIERNMSAA